MAGEVERTLVLFKPDAVQRGVVGEILTRFERVGLKIVGVKMISPDKQQFYRHYEEIGKMITRRGEDTFNVTLEMMLQGPVIAMVLEGVEAVQLVRKLVGTTEPKASPPGTIRGDYSHMSFVYADSTHRGVPNLIHASGSDTEAVEEIGHWFSDSEMFQYESLNDKFTL